jgi:hypothetical protein
MYSFFGQFETEKELETAMLNTFRTNPDKYLKALRNGQNSATSRRGKVWKAKNQRGRLGDCSQHFPDAVGCFTWFCWNCGDKDNTAKCYMYYKNTLAGFLLSLFEQQNGNAKTLIRHVKEWDSQRPHPHP